MIKTPSSYSLIFPRYRTYVILGYAVKRFYIYHREEMSRALSHRIPILIGRIITERMLYRGVVLLLVCGILLETVQLGKDVLGHIQQESPTTTKAAPNPIPSSENLVATIIASHLFGTASPVATIAQKIADPGPITLVGTIYMVSPDQSLALIGANDKEKTYRIGDTLPNGSILNSITPGGIVMLRDGTQFSLDLHKTIDLSKPVAWVSFRNQGISPSPSSASDAIAQTMPAANAGIAGGINLGTRVIVPPDPVQGKHIDPSHASRKRHTARFKKAMHPPDEQ
jgi:hypothetical protein